MLDKAYQRAKRILQENREKMDMLVEALLKQETLNRAEFVALMDEGIMPEGEAADKPRTVREILKEAAEENPAEAPAEDRPEQTGETGETASNPEEGLPPQEEDHREYLND